MKSGVGEDGIEFVFEAKILAVHYQDLQPASPGRGNLRQAGVNAHYPTAERSNSFRERAIAASQVENHLTRFGRKDLDKGRAEIRDEAGVARVTLRVPGSRRAHNLFK